MNPAKAYNSISQSIATLSLESLYQYTNTKLPLELEPLLADGMPLVSADKKAYTIKIKKNELFQLDPAFPNQTRELKAQDFVYAWRRSSFENGMDLVY